MSKQKPDSTLPVVHRPAPYHPDSWWHAWLIGRPLPTADAPHQAIGKKIGLAVFASDALSSTAYATQEILIVLAVAGMLAFRYAWPISLAIVVLLAIVTISYQQTIHAYPDGGGAYIVSRDNLGVLPSQIAGAALLTDYILAVSVSTSAGVAQIVSAFPILSEYRVPIAVGLVILVMLVNLRGVKESGFIFAIPTYFFLVMISLTVIVGLVRSITGTLGMVVNPPHVETVALQTVTLFLLLHAFSSGTTALTGVEAISNGVTAFKEPRSHNAARTLIWMSVILGTLFLGITFLTLQIHAIPSENETIISQLARTVLGGQGFLYLCVIVATTMILVMAANTAFADFPRLSAIQAGDRFLPRQFTYRGSRLVYSWGIIILSLIACLLIIIFQASVTGLIPLYAIGVFLSFTLSQAGMAHRWWKVGQLKPDEERHEPGSILHHEPTWRWKMVLNGFGAASTAIVALIFAVTKFQDGAWVVILIIPSLVAVFYAINRHYQNLAKQLSLEHSAPLPRYRRQRVILPVEGVHQGTLYALRYARSLSKDVTAIHVSVDPDRAERLQQRWLQWGEGVPLLIIDSPYREMFHPLVSYIDEVSSSRKADELITVIVPEFVPQKWWHNLLHMQTATWLRLALRKYEGIVVVDVPYLVR